jgi:RNA polymerase sigma-70 factor, ECF subfamily
MEDALLAGVIVKDFAGNSDFDLVRSFQEGNMASFECLVEKYREKIRNIIFLILNDSSVVDDLSQDIFIKVYESLSDFRSESSFYTWLYRITINKCRDEIRKKKIRKFISLDFRTKKGDEFMYVKDQYSGLDDNFLIEQAMVQLSAQQREIIILKDINDLSYNEIADILECGIGTVKSRLARARMELARIVKNLIGDENE